MIRLNGVCFICMFVSFERKQRYDYFSVYKKRYSVIFRVPFCFYLRKKWILYIFQGSNTFLERLDDAFGIRLFLALHLDNGCRSVIYKLFIAQFL